MTAHYVRTLDIWSKKLEAARDKAIEVTSTKRSTTVTCTT